MEILHFMGYALVMVMWAVVGLVCWIPLIFRVTAMIAGGVLYHIFNRSQPPDLSERFRDAVEFYPRGFAMINDIIRLRGQPLPVRSAASTNQPNFPRFLIEVTWTALFWISFVLIAKWLR